MFVKKQKNENLKVIIMYSILANDIHQQQICKHIEQIRREKFSSSGSKRKTPIHNKHFIFIKFDSLYITYLNVI